MIGKDSKRYCADPQAIAAMAHDGLGWGHDLQCGCFRVAQEQTGRPGIGQRLAALIGRK
ncbi:hypothetical protein [Yoonia sediminilitoris]|uniref:Uncharacterized protein n=1 Tax=Yoonia sediminilitoris TaxID=1286148 RepID=A0A2T6KRY1_9RHOB|nr:hypothetical protein [Yoonia sediminilitoris]PUB19326.1 hypothetical protein C8N45_101923 [Yoonia sediminilitoris]RCW99494.1 hypothetical protein DFP92_101923 [Yoonia sediminilitoris]